MTTAPIPPARESLTWTVAEAAEVLGISVDLVYDLVRRGEIPARKLGARWFISKARLTAFIDGDVQGDAA